MAAARAQTDPGDRPADAPPPRRGAEPAAPRVLVVIPAKDAEATLPACIAGVAASALRPAAVVVVDDGSSDDTAAIAEAGGATVLRTDPAPLGPGRARDLAVRESAPGGSEGFPPTDVVALVDADVVVHPDALGLLVGELRRDPGVVAAFGSYDDDPPAPAVPSRYANLRHHFVHQRAGGEAASFWAGLGVVRRDAWDAAGGFGDRYDRPAIEDIDLGRRLVAAGGRIRCNPAAQATHLKAWTLRQLWRTDVFQRALPWSRLLVREPAVEPVAPPPGTPAAGEAPSKLNTGRADQLSAVAVHGVWFWGLVALLVSPWLLAVAAACVVVWVGLNAGFLRLLLRRGGPGLLLGGGLLHAIYHGYASVAFAWVLLETRWLRAGGRSDKGARILAATAVAGAALGAAGLLGLAVLPGGPLERLLGAVGADAGPGAVGSFRVRAAGLSLFFAGLAAAAAAVGPRGVAAVLRDGRSIRAALLTPLRRPLPLAVLAAATAVCAARIAWHVEDLPLRADEAQSFFRSGGGSPLYPVLFWTSPNNHVLHSVLMRVSVMLFGAKPWAIRLPAAAFTAASVPLVFLGLRRHLGAAAALLAAAAWAGSGYAVEAGTNARGYPIVVAATLALLALAPAVRAGRPAATALAAAAAAVGAWAVPVMAVPFAAVCAYVVWGNLRRSRAAAARAGLLAAGTGGLTGLLYAPTLLLVQPSESGAASAARDAMAPLSLPERLEVLGNNVLSAWEQMAWPLLGPLAAGLAALALLGVLVALLRGGRARVFVVAALTGPAALLLLLGVPPLPWWTLGFGFPVALGLAAYAAVAGASLLARRPAPRGVGPAVAAVAAAVLALQAGFTATADHRAAFPNQVGYGDAPAAAAVVEGLLAEPGAAPLRVVTGPARRTSLGYHLLQRRLRADPAAGLGAGMRGLLYGPRSLVVGDVPGPPVPGGRVLVVVRDGEPAPDAAGLLDGLEPTRSWRFTESELRLYEAPAPAPAPGG